MAKQHPKQIASILASSNTSSLERLLQRAGQLQHLNDLFCSIIPDSISKQCSIANIRQTKLILFTSNSAWATRIRFQSIEILVQLRTAPEFEQFTEIEVRIKPN